jgi:hypothetical protein
MYSNLGYKSLYGNADNLGNSGGVLLRDVGGWRSG